LKRYFITGNGTDIGKTIASAVLVEALQADYWKPVQCGSLDNTDTDIVRSLISNKISTIFPETYRFKSASSPHHASALENIIISMNDFELPNTKTILIIEGAGGALVPLNNSDLVIDFASKFRCEVIIVSKNYLGSINHTLLTVEALQSRNMVIKGIIFNGPKNKFSEEIIALKTSIPIIGYIPKFNVVNSDTVLRLAKVYSNILT